ncbi:MAG: DUF1080 domain-containing protein [Planctomycetota bacterium]|nr:MAG: DUF1080 domain-containing protein [Planctomycetota bacterium]
MRTILATTVILAVGLFVSEKAFGQCYEGPAEGTPIFNGKDLSGWVVEGAGEYEADGQRKPVWRVEDGKIVCDGHGFGFLRYDTPFRDFVLHVEFRMISKNCNSGVGIRGAKFDPKHFETRPSVSGYEVQILDDSGKKPDKHSSGSLYRYIAPKKNAVKPTGEWNVLEIACLGPVVRVVLNGEELYTIDQRDIDELSEKPLEGYVSVQNHGHQVEFRNITVREMQRVASRRCR